MRNTSLSVLGVDESRTEFAGDDITMDSRKTMDDNQYNYQSKRLIVVYVGFVNLSRGPDPSTNLDINHLITSVYR